MNEEEIEKAKGWLSALNVNSEFEASSKEILLSHIEELEFQNNALQTEHKYNINRIKQLEFQIQAKEMEHKYDINMIDEVKGEAVKLYKEIDKQNKIIDEMADIIKDYDIDYSDICKHRIVQSCPEAPKSCKECIKQHFEKKVE